MNILGLTVNIDRRPSARVRWTRRALVLAVANVAVLGGGVASAYWSTTGSGTGTATADTAQPLTASVAHVTSSSTLLVPGGTAAPLIVNIHNPNTFTVNITAVTLTNNQAWDSIGGNPKNSSSCTATASKVVLVGSASASGLSTAVAGHGDATVTLPGAVSMGTDSDDGCQGASFTFSTGISVTAQTG